MLKPLTDLKATPFLNNLACTFILASIFLNEAVGSLPLYGALALVLMAIACWPRPFSAILLSPRTWYLWLLPLLALLSAAWSPVSGQTVRGSIQLGITVAIGLALTSLATPKDLRRNLLVVLSIIIALGVFKNNYTMDGMTQRVNWTGLYNNKNTMCFVGACFVLLCAANMLSRSRVGYVRMVWAAGIPIGYAICIAARSVAIVGVMTVCLVLLLILSSATTLRRGVRRPYVEMISVGSVIVAALVAGAVLLFQNDLLMLVNKDSTLTGRTVLWYWADRMTHGYYWLGYGYHGFWLKGSAIPEYLWNQFHIPTRMGFHFHSLYYEIQIELGVLGVVLSALTIVLALFNGYLWILRTTSIDSIVYFVISLMVVLLQVQGVDLFMEFNASYLLFIVGASFAHGERDSLARSPRGRPAGLVVATELPVGS